MTPAARDAAAIDVLDRWTAGEAAEAALTRWARGARYAGSSDREAVRDLVFSAIRRARSALALGGGAPDIFAEAGSLPAPGSGRALVLGLIRDRMGAGNRGDLRSGPDAISAALPDWTGTAHTPPPLTEGEAARLTAPRPPLTRGQALDMPDWLLPRLDAGLGADTDANLAALRDRAPVFVRVHAGRCTPERAVQILAADGITATPHPLSPWALHLTSGARRLRHSDAYAQGLVEPQDAASQAVVAAFAKALPHGAGVLDYCAGGGGKSLALAALDHPVTAHDAAPARMRDLPERAARARTPVTVCTQPQGGWAAVLADVPCSGSGSWRRAPEAKWALTPQKLADLTALQARILAGVGDLVAPGGVLGYATCSLLAEENHHQIARFLAARPGWQALSQRAWTALDGGDGFFLAVLRRG